MIKPNEQISAFWQGIEQWYFVHCSTRALELARIPEHLNRVDIARLGARNRNSDFFSTS